MAALAARAIVARRCAFVYCHALGILVGEAIEFYTVEGNSLFPNTDFAQIGARVLVKHPAAHAEIGGRLAHADKSRRNFGHLSNPLKFHSSGRGWESQ